MPFVAIYGATRDRLFEIIPPTTTVDGDLLDQDGDGIPELLTGYRLYHEDGTFIQEYEDNLITQFIARMNLSFNTSYCFYATAYSAYGESEASNIVCRVITPGRPDKFIIKD